MTFTNNYTAPVIVFLFPLDDLSFARVAANPTGDPNLAWARYDEIVAPGSTTSTLTLSGKHCHVGLKLAVFLGGAGPYLVAPTLVDYPDDAQLVLTNTPELLWTNRPVAADPNPRVPSSELTRPLPRAPGYVVGVGKADVGDPSAADVNSQLPMQGWANSDQKTERIESPLAARAFIIGHPAEQSRVVLVVVDIWSCSIAIKQEVVRRLQRGNAEVPYRDDNVWIAGTHTHSGPASFLHHFIYNGMAGGFDPHVFDCIVTGIVQAIENAHMDLAPGKVFVGKGFVPSLGHNRSEGAFDKNPQADRNNFPVVNKVDEAMILLKFVRTGVNAGDPDEPVGLLNWYALHPTNRGRKETAVNGDHKGRAATLAEVSADTIPNARSNSFVAAFANSCCGDVSGNFVIDPQRGLTFDPPLDTDRRFQQRMEDAATVQATVARGIFDAATDELTGPIGVRHQYINLPKRAGANGAFGLSMPAGSAEDSGPTVLPEGIARTDTHDPNITTDGVVASLVTGASIVLQPIVNTLVMLLNSLAAGTPVNFSISALPSLRETTAHFPKPIMLLTGTLKPVPFTPNIIPIQILQIGKFALLGVAAEVTTVAGLRLKQAVAEALSKREASFVAVGTYANGYSSYVTTPEEYAAQHYEGASTLFGPRTLRAYENAFQKMAEALVKGRPVKDDAPSPDLRDAVLTKRRMTFRNLSTKVERFRIFRPDDHTYWATLLPAHEGDFMVPPGGDRAVIIPFPFSLFPNVQVVIGTSTLGPFGPPPAPTERLYPLTSDLILIRSDGLPMTCPYFAPSRTF